MIKILMLMLSFSLFAYQVDTEIIAIEDNGRNSLDVLVSHDGRIFAVDKSNEVLVNKLRLAHALNATVRLDLLHDEFSFDVLSKVEDINDVKMLSLDKFVREKNLDRTPTPLDGYTPTDLGSYDKANKIFRTLGRVGRTQRKSQCFNRAYMWSKHMYDNFRVNSMKIFIYYSKRYREEIPKSKWWFHVAPLVKAGNEYYSMDWEFNRTPKTALDWENFFTGQIPDRRYDCLKITNYSEFKRNYNNYNEWCMIQYTSMYYWEPNDMIRLEKTGQRRTRFHDSIIKAASKEAFRKWPKVYERYKL